ncbi:unnamed protein product [Prunus armeniaca]
MPVVPILPYRSRFELMDRLYSADDLYTVRHREDEPLREYVVRFSHEYSRCPKTDDKKAYDAFKSGLRSFHFRYLVHSSNSSTPRLNISTLNPGLRLGRRNQHQRAILGGLTTFGQVTSEMMTVIIGKEAQRRGVGNTVATTTERHYRITIVLRKSSLC